MAYHLFGGPYLCAMVQRNKGINFTVRFKGGSNFGQTYNPLTRSVEVLSDPEDPLAILTEGGIPILTELGDFIITEYAPSTPAPLLQMDYTNATVSSGLITVWNDASGGLVFSATVGEEPVTGTTGIGFFGADSIDFGATATSDSDGVSQGGTTGKAGVAFLHSGAMTFLAVVKHKGSSATQYVFDSSRALAANYGFSLLILSGGACEARISNGTGTFVANPKLNISGTVDGSDQIIIVRVTGSVCQLNNVYTIGQSPLTGLVEVPLTGNLTGSDASFAPYIGASSRTTSTLRFTGSMGEVIGWNVALTDNQLTGTISDLAFKWSLFTVGE